MSQDAANAKLEVKWTVEFYAKEIAAHAVYDVSVFLQNDDGLGDPDVRRKRIGTDWVAAQSQPIQRQVTATVDRHFLNEDWQLVLVGDSIGTGGLKRRAACVCLWYSLIWVEALGYFTKYSAVVGMPPEVTDLDIALEP